MAHRNTKNLIPHSKQGRSLYPSFPTYKEQKTLNDKPWHQKWQDRKERTDLQADRVDHYLFSETVQSHLIQISEKLNFFFTSVSFHDNITFPHNWFNQSMHAVQEEKKTYIDWNDICTQ